MINPTYRYVERALADNGLIELRHQAGKKWTAGLFDNAESLLAVARGRHQIGNLFTSLNRPSPRVADNRMGSSPLGNDDIQWITRLLFDFDPSRPKGCSSTKDELHHAQHSATELFSSLRAMGWPDPLVTISGNGAHLLYRCHLPNTDDVREQLTAVYTGLRQDCTTDKVDFDRTVRNPGRICALYGAVKRKGVNTPDRPHRRSRIVTWPRDWKQVQRQSFDGLADFYAAKQKPVTSGYKAVVPVGRRVDGSGDYTTLDVVAWFTANGLYEHHITDIIHAVKCPWEGEHTETHRNDTVVYANGDGTWPGFHCKHSHCGGRTIQDVMNLLGDADTFCALSWERKP
ncbi:MAG: hypothetical protein ABFS45_12200 [Pseudomonadota bacterium]